MTVAVINWTNPAVGSTQLPIASINIFDAVNGAPAAQIGQAAAPVNGPAPTTFTTGDLVPGTHVFTLVVQDTQNNQGPATAGVTATVQAAAPGVATNVTVTLNTSL